MAVILEYTSIIVPIKTIIEKLGMAHFKLRYDEVVDPDWRDEHLFREGAMNPYDISDMLRDWEEKGFQCMETLGGKKQWKDVCLVDYFKGPTYPCTWLNFDPGDHCVWLAGTPKGKIIGPRNRDIERDPVILTP